MVDKHGLHDGCNYLGIVLEDENLWFCNKCGNGGPIWIWVVWVEWGPDSCDPMTYVKAVWTDETKANEDAKAYGPNASVVKIRINRPDGMEMM